MLLLAACDAASPTESINPAAVTTAVPTKTLQLITPSPSASPALTVLPSITKATSAISQDWQSDWLNGIPCRPPCFANIIPGRTTAADALKVLKQNPRVAAAQMSTNDGYGLIEWSWTLTSPRSINGHGGNASFESNSPSQVIYLISLDSNVSLAEVVKAYGEPTHIRATFQRVETGQIMYTVDLLYLSQGLILFDGSKYQKTIIGNNLFFTRLGFFAPGMEGYKNAYPQKEYRYIVPWKGINSFDFYCQTQLLNGDEDCTKV
jgi:hypothetical protein